MPAITKSGKFLTKTKTQADIGGLPSIRLYEKQLGSQGATSYTVFTLSGAYVPNSNTLNVFVNGHRAEKVLSGATNATQYIETNAKKITFGASLQTTDVVEFVIFGSYPVSNYEYNTNTYEYTTVTSGTQVVLPFTPNVLISVYIDGVRQQSDGFTISGTTVTFAESLPGGTKLLFVSPNTDDTPIINTDTLDGYHLSELFGKLPNCDDSSIGTDLTGFNGFARILNNSVKAGTTFSKGVVSTYSLAYTIATAYYGGVLDPNGDIHFVPYSATVGQKVSVAGVVSTYSLAGLYMGGVLDPNGNIHFVPTAATVGQKVSSAGVVSTYSLVYTTGTAYIGGVLAPNGDIHFVPFYATVGQKVSATGVVSTYSLVYTTSAGAYVGGVLAPNGDIHFVPRNAEVGQKISTAGVVSTYSLVYTTSAGAYGGGVLDPNGDIHLVPSGATVGQKINSSGVISTYSLVYTTTNAYIGGVLAPNGDIHFVPRNAEVGQKISTAGVVSTYSLVYTTSAGAYVGGVLAPNGDIHFVPYNAAVGQKISTMSALPLSLAVCCSPFLNKL